ncbi:MAG: tetratricopeptide repeat protein [Alphaproteobacteria bacterium]|nr:tetratricopeptide repeat protein [Alphaproteobacteria bacterium]
MRPQIPLIFFSLSLFLAIQALAMQLARPALAGRPRLALGLFLSLFLSLFLFMDAPIQTIATVKAHTDPEHSSRPNTEQDAQQPAKQNREEPPKQTTTPTQPTPKSAIDDYQKGLQAAIQGDYDTALEWYHKAAEAGYANAQSSLGWIYHTGEFVPRDYEKAYYWTRKAATQGDIRAQYYLAIAYRNGEGVTPDPAQELKWLRSAAQQGDILAQTALGQVYINGELVLKNYETGIEWITKAANQTYAEAQYILGKIYLAGKITAKDEQTAYKWFLLAIVYGDERAQEYITILEGSLSATQIANAQNEATEWKNQFSNDRHLTGGTE